MIPIELTNQQALAFRLLSMADAWDLKNGSITLHFDGQGMPVQAEIRKVVHQKLSPQTIETVGQVLQVVI